MYIFQFSSKPGSTSSAPPKDQGNGTSGDQTGSKPADTTVPEDITNFYDKMDKEDEDDDKEKEKEKSMMMKVNTGIRSIQTGCDNGRNKNHLRGLHQLPGLLKTYISCIMIKEQR